MFSKKCEERIEIIFNERISKLPAVKHEIEAASRKYDADIEIIMKYLYGTMPLSDMGNYPLATFLDYARQGVYLWKNSPLMKNISEDIFLNYILYHRVNEEEIKPCRTLFFDRLCSRIENKSAKRTALEVNYWCAEEASYQATDDRTRSALGIYETGFGRCGEESVFAINALRSVGLPARQVYAPKWSHCDDNHAWVEVYCDGKWYFMGACEPEEILNKGWFTNAASRAMLVRSLWFDQIFPSEEMIGKSGLVTVLNQLERYALSKEVTVRVKDDKGNAVSKAKVDFQVLNYAEFATIATVDTDEQGMAKIKLGYGTVLVQVSKEGCISTHQLERQENDCEIRLGKKEKPGQWINFDMSAPKDAPVNVNQPTDIQKKAGQERFKEANRKRLNKVAGRKKSDNSFLKPEYNSLRKDMLATLSKKDYDDFDAAVLEEHFNDSMPYIGRFTKPIFLKYIMCPRIHHEPITSWRNDIKSFFDERQKAEFEQNPVSIWRYIQKHIKEEPQNEDSKLVTTPTPCLKMGIGSELSRKVLFVAIARTLGIPARLNPIDDAAEYWRKDGFLSVIDEKQKNAYLILNTKDTDINWSYFQNWSIAKLEEGAYKSLCLKDKLWEDSKLELELACGEYRIITANRLPNGNLFARKYCFMLKNNEKKSIELSLRKADLGDMLEEISLTPFSLFNEEGESIQVKDLTSEGKSLFIFLEEGKEPTEHILNELMEDQEKYRICTGKILFVIRNRTALSDITISKCLKAIPNIQVCYGDFSELIDTLARRMYVDPDNMPLIMITNGILNGIFAASGYNVGIGDMLLRIMNM